MLTQKEKAAMFSRMKSIYEDPSAFNNTKCLAVIAMCVLSATCCLTVNNERPERRVNMTKNEIKEELEEQLQLLSQLSHEKDLSMEERLSVIREIDSISKTIVMFFS